MSIAERVFEARNKNGWSQRELAKRCNVSQGTISLIEKGEISPSTTTLSELAKALDCTVAELMGESVETRMPTNEELKFALFGGDKEITDEQFEEVKRYAQYIKERGSNDK